VNPHVQNVRCSYLKTLACAAALFALNAYITRDLFRVDYTNHLGSIEAAFIGLGRYASQHWGDLGWFPLWYGGIPYPDAYPPLLHWCSGLALTVSGATPGLAYHFVTASFYALGPVALFWMAWRVCGNRACAFAAAVGYSLISPSCFLVKEVRDSVGGVLGPRRLETLVVYGEGPHVASVCLLALAIGMLHVALAKRKPWYWVAAALAIASVPLTNWLGAVAVAMATAAYLLSGFAEGRRAWLRMAGGGAYAYALVVPWLSPSAIGVIRANAPRVALNYTFHTGNRLLTVAMLIAFPALAWGLRRWKAPPHLRFASLFLLVTAVTALFGYWFNLSLFPQPGRYHLEMDMAFWLAAAFAAWPLVQRTDRRVSQAAALVALVLCVPLVRHDRRIARAWERPIDIRNTIEYKSAQWLNRNRPQARVFAAGSIGFWLPAFSDAPQIGGGNDNGVTNRLIPDFIFQTFAGEKQRVMIDQMRALGVELMIAGGKNSAEHYHPIAHPEKFAGMSELWHNGDDFIYELPGRSRSLAHVMRPGDLVRAEPAAYESDYLREYLAALNNPGYPAATMRWRGPSAASITVDLRPGQIVSVQMSYDKGWNATVAGRSVPMRRDRMGQTVIEPGCSGVCTVQLQYDGGAEGVWARWIQRLACAAGLAWMVMGAWRRKP
jgi:hypothetical protein